MRKANDFKRFCPKHYKEIKNYDLAEKDGFIGWVCHHINGEWWPKEWLIKNNMYYDRTDPHEFVFLPYTSQKSKETGIPTHKAVHMRTSDGKLSALRGGSKLKGRKGHPHTSEFKEKISKLMSGKFVSQETREKLSKAQQNSMNNVNTEFSIKYREHYGISKRINIKLYNKERYFYKVNGYCSWEKK